MIFVLLGIAGLLPLLLPVVLLSLFFSVALVGHFSILYILTSGTLLLSVPVSILVTAGTYEGLYYRPYLKSGSFSLVLVILGSLIALRSSLLFDFMEKILLRLNQQSSLPELLLFSVSLLAKGISLGFLLFLLFAFVQTTFEFVAGWVSSSLSIDTTHVKIKALRPVLGWLLVCMLISHVADFLGGQYFYFFG